MAAARPESPQELAVKTDFRTNIWSVFQDLYEDRWDQGESLVSCAAPIFFMLTRTLAARWNAAVGEWLVPHCARQPEL